MNSLFSSNVSISISLDGESDRPMHTILQIPPSDYAYSPLKNGLGMIADRVPIYNSGETVKGRVLLAWKGGKSSSTTDVTAAPTEGYEHQGIKIELIGELETPSELPNGGKKQFRSLLCPLAGPGLIPSATLVSLAFEFKAVDAPYESYKGQHIGCRYFLRATMARRMLSDSVEVDLWFLEATDAANDSKPNDEAQTGQEPAAPGSPTPARPGHGMEVEVGLGNSIYFIISLPSTHYSLLQDEVMLGWLAMVKSCVHIQSIELSLIRREFVGEEGVGDHVTLCKQQICDGDVHAGNPLFA